MRWRTPLICLLLSLVQIPTATAAAPQQKALAHSFMSLPARTRLSVRYCASSGISATPRDITIARNRISHRLQAVAPVHAGVMQSGSRCLRLSITGNMARPAVLRMVMATGSLVIANSGTSALSRGTPVRVLGRSGSTRLATNPPILPLVLSLWSARSGHASTGLDTAGQPFISFGLTRRAASTWCSFTKSHIMGYAAFVLDSRVVEDAQIEGAICSGTGQIVGLTDTAQARVMAAYVNFGPLPITFHATSPGH